MIYPPRPSPTPADYRQRVHLSNLQETGRDMVTHSDFFDWLKRREAAVRLDVANSLRAAGYEVIHTGGGCLAWMRRITHQEHILITSNNDISGDPDTRSWEIGRYAENGWVNLEESFTLEEAIRCAGLLPPTVDTNGDPVQRIYPSLDAARAELSRPEDRRG
jgi:hypothetical protein